MEEKEKIKKLKGEIKELQRRRLRVKSNGNNKANVSRRMSNEFNEKTNEFGYINNKREENGFDKLSQPKITDLIYRHKLWKKIEQDIIYFNTELDPMNNVGEFPNE